MKLNYSIMEMTEKYYMGINFRSDEVDINTFRMGDLFAIAFDKLQPNGAEMPSCKAVSILLMQKGVKVVEVIRNRDNKYTFSCRFYY